MSQLGLSVQGLRHHVIQLARIHLGLAGAYVVFIVASDAWGLVTRQLTWQRWAVCAALLMVMTAIAYFGRLEGQSANYYRALIVVTVLVDLALASFVVYSERGMASRGVALYGLAIVSSAALMSRSVVMGAATLATAAYIFAATSYFYFNFNEGYKAELYTTLGLYCASFYILAAMLSLFLAPSHRPRRH